ncbi:MAG: PAS domain S-box protein [Proteobacteria bacterium]|nr:PAS domain S-box protein [Pseudomonadota bacterium]
MKDPSMTKPELIKEISVLKKRIHELEQTETELKRVEEALHESETKYRSLFENAVEGIFRATMEGRLLSANPALAKLLGYNSPQEFMEQITDIGGQYYANPADRETFKNTLEAEGIIKGFETQLLNKDGKPVWASLNARAIRNDEGALIYQEGTVEGITDRKLAEEALWESEGKYRILFESINDAVFLHDLDEEGLPGRFLQVNDVACRRLGYTREELLSLAPRDITLPEEYERIADKRISLTSQVDILVDTIHVTKDGLRIPVESNIRKFQYLGRQAALSISRDITDRKRMEEELLRAHKLESLGVLAGGIAHDFNNLMAIAWGYIDLALINLPADHVSRKRLLTAMQSIEQTKDLTSKLITFSRGGGPHMKIFDVTEIIRDAVHRTAKGTKVSVKFDFMDNLRPVEVDKLQMKQCFYNLTTNAVEAMPQGGNLTVQVENVEIPDGEDLALKGGPYLKMTFTDEGIGIPYEHLSKIFDPYFTTKEMDAQKGLGLGLAVCYSVLKKHGGHITVKSQPGKGTSFALYLPEPMDPAKEKEFKKTLSTDTFRVLIMDDEPQIRAIERAYLERLGYDVTDVKDGQEALDTYRKALHSGAPFDLVLLDLTVRQGLGGQFAMEWMLKIDPSIKAIIASGYVDDPVIVNYADYGFQGALKKPFKRKEVKNLVEKILHGN